MELTLGLLMGFAYMASPGPMTSETLRRGAIFGFPAAISVQLGGMIGHVAYALLAYFGVHFLLGSDLLQMTLGVFSFGLLIYLGVSTIKDRNVFSNVVEGNGRPGCSIIKTFGAGALISLSNPFAIAFWLSLSSQAKNIPVDSITFLSGFFVSLVVVAIALIFLASYWMQRMSLRWSQVVIMGCGLILIGFGLKVGYSVMLML